MTATTQLQHYKTHSSRSNHLFIHFDAGKFGFEQECILDIDSGLFSIKEENFNNHQFSFIKKGKFDENTLKRVYNLIIKSHHIPKKEKQDIHQSLNFVGIIQLKQP